MIATVRSERDELVVKQGGAHEIVRTDGISGDQVVERLRSLAPQGMDHIVEVAFHANITTDEKVLAQGGSPRYLRHGRSGTVNSLLAAGLQNIRLFFLGSDDFPAEAKATAAAELNESLDGGWPGLEIAERFPLNSIAEAHEFVERSRGSGRVVVTVTR